MDILVYFKCILVVVCVLEKLVRVEERVCYVWGFVMECRERVVLSLVEVFMMRWFNFYFKNICDF